MIKPSCPSPGVHSPKLGLQLPHDLLVLPSFAALAALSELSPSTARACRGSPNPKPSDDPSPSPPEHEPTSPPTDPSPPPHAAPAPPPHSPHATSTPDPSDAG